MGKAVGRSQVLTGITRAKAAANRDAREMTPQDFCNGLLAALTDDTTEGEEIQTLQHGTLPSLRDAFLGRRWDAFGIQVQRLGPTLAQEKQQRAMRAGGGPVSVTVDQIAEQIGRKPGEVRPTVDELVKEGLAEKVDGGLVLTDRGTGVVAGTGSGDLEIRKQKARKLLEESP